MHATLNRAALVRGADVVIVALEGHCTLADSFATAVVEGASIAIVARQFIGLVETSEVLVAAIIGAEVAIVASQRWPRLAQATNARIVEGARVLVATRCFIVGVLTATLRSTDIIGAWVLVVTVESLSANTGPI